VSNGSCSSISSIEDVEDIIEERSSGEGSRPLIVMFAAAVWNTLFIYCLSQVSILICYRALRETG
jgi:hypothetical protein